MPFGTSAYTRFYGVLGNPIKGNQGLKGDPGPSLKVLGTFNTLTELQTAHPNGALLDGVFLVGSASPYYIYFWNYGISRWETRSTWTAIPGPVGPQGPQGFIGPIGPPGPRGLKGDDGRSFTILGVKATYEILIAEDPQGSAGDAWAVGNDVQNVVYIWDTDIEAWVSLGAIIGPPGPQGPIGLTGPRGLQGEVGPIGPVGPQGRNFDVRGIFASLQELMAARPNPAVGDAYFIGSTPPYTVYVYGDDGSGTDTWFNAGPIQGPAGEPGPIPVGALMAIKTFTTVLTALGWVQQTSGADIGLWHNVVLDASVTSTRRADVSPFGIDPIPAFRGDTDNGRLVFVAKSKPTKDVAITVTIYDLIVDTDDPDNWTKTGESPQMILAKLITVAGPGSDLTANLVSCQGPDSGHPSSVQEQISEIWSVLGSVNELLEARLDGEI